ncbi:hypothetical protein P8C59_001457 [Phyllachora maydis]|uniref:4a-hydroxytetrahydrobiopterin dehydratase n=1 Tax=Phyllachora maydis TaxID=1825666 RepID=A0AAD9HZL2_9PEZI|nr:hypothetical protein P8C59_001457 [Phyllachora maydis]
MSPRFSAGTDTSTLEAALSPLLVQTGGRWTLAADGEGLERSFRFKTFAKAWLLVPPASCGLADKDFMTAVSLQCKVRNHHPEWSNVYNTTFIRWKTHSPQGLSSKDIDLAAVCDALAEDFGEVTSSAEATPQTNRGVCRFGHWRGLEEVPR